MRVCWDTFLSLYIYLLGWPLFVSELSLSIFTIGWRTMTTRVAVCPLHVFIHQWYFCVFTSYCIFFSRAYTQRKSNYGISDFIFFTSFQPVVGHIINQTVQCCSHPCVIIINICKLSLNLTHWHIIPKSLPWSGDCGVVAASWSVVELVESKKERNMS